MPCSTNSSMSIPCISIKVVRQPNMTQNDRSIPSNVETSSPIRSNRLAIRSVLIAVVAFELLNLTNFCYRDLRYYSEHDWIDRAVKENLRRHDPQGARNKSYSSLEEFYSQNEHCCRIIYFTKLIYTPHLLEVSPLTRLLCVKEFLVTVHYRSSDTEQKYKYYESFVRMNSCGDILGVMGTQNDYPP
jgi:hypothetical protein